MGTGVEGGELDVPGLGGRYSDGDGRFIGCCPLVTFKDVVLEVSWVCRCVGALLGLAMGDVPIGVGSGRPCGWGAAGLWVVSWVIKQLS